MTTRDLMAQRVNKLEKAVECLKEVEPGLPITWGPIQIYYSYEMDVFFVKDTNVGNMLFMTANAVSQFIICNISAVGGVIDDSRSD